jgi:hypothetical protein
MLNIFEGTGASAFLLTTLGTLHYPTSWKLPDLVPIDFLEPVAILVSDNSADPWVETSTSAPEYG